MYLICFIYRFFLLVIITNIDIIINFIRNNNLIFVYLMVDIKANHILY